MPLRVVLVDDHEVVRNGIKSLLEETPDVSVVGEAGSVKEAIARVEWARPDVVIMDVRLPDGSGIEATREIRARLPKTQILMLTTFADDEALFASIMAGAAGYVLKQIKGADLVRAVRTVGRGESLLDPAVTKGVLDRLRKGKHLLKDERLARLSAQEERILELIADGKTNSEIGQKLHLAEKTVKNYVTSILSKLEVARRADGNSAASGNVRAAEGPRGGVRHRVVPSTSQVGSSFSRHHRGRQPHVDGAHRSRLARRGGHDRRRLARAQRCYRVSTWKRQPSGRAP